MTTQILVIEDLPANLKLLRVILEAFGYKVLAAEDGYAGLQTAREARPDLVLCDLLMDGLDGFGVAREIRGDTILKRVPLVAVTALVTDGVEQKVFDSGFDGYITKPIEARKFVPQLEKFLPENLRTSTLPH
ncbi:response regulator [Nisaea nitritireducens]|uniref:response regulator n=1 Tax=Nisaea nitritireducens TaxID=568392 RepID=UPI001865F61A|nr:response regulator [Nisaea nitritireducens]